MERDLPELIKNGLKNSLRFPLNLISALLAQLNFLLSLKIL